MPNSFCDSDAIVQIPYITNVPRDGRSLILLPFFDNIKNEWHQYVYTRARKFSQIPVEDLVEGLYLARSPADSRSDYFYFLGTFIFQHLSFKMVAKRYLQLEKTIHYFAACLENYHRISSSSSSVGGILLIEAELGYLLILVGRFYDLLQKMMKEAGALVKDIHDTSRALLHSLPHGFADIVEFKDRTRTSQEIMEKWNLPKQIADFYVSEAKHFLLVRSIRVDLEHRGKSTGPIFNHPDGYAVSISSPPWSDFPIWNAAAKRPNNLGSARAIFAYLINDALDLGSRFIKAFSSCIGTPQAIANDINCYLRNPFSHHLLMLPTMVTRPWERFKYSDALCP